MHIFFKSRALKKPYSHQYMISAIIQVLLQQVLRDGSSSCFPQQYSEPFLAFVSFMYPVSSPRHTPRAHGDRKQRQKRGQLLQMSSYRLIPMTSWAKATGLVQGRSPEMGGPPSSGPCCVTGDTPAASYIITHSFLQ